MEKRVYVFDPRADSGYLFRAPEWLAKLFCRIAKRYDYAVTEKGY